MHTCTDAYTLSDDGMGADDGRVGLAHEAMQGHTGIHDIMQRGLGADLGNQMDKNVC